MCVRVIGQLGVYVCRGDMGHGGWLGVFLAVYVRMGELVVVWWGGGLVSTNIWQRHVKVTTFL